MKCIKTTTVLVVATFLSIPVLGYAAPKANPQPMVAAQTQTTHALVNINTADATVLERVVGLGPAKAKAIVGYREKHGNFKSIDDLSNVQGIGPKLFEKVKAQITV
jgi:competence protein ComEA